MTQSPSTPTADSSVTSPRIGRYRWLVCSLLFFATTVNYMDRQILSLLKPILDVELGWTNAEFGKVNAAFQGAYAVGLLLFGAFIDRFGTKIGYSVSIAAWSLAALSHALASSLTGFFTVRVALGLGEGGNFPAAIKAVALWFPKKERAFATALFNSGANVGAITAPLVVPWIALTWGWQAAFVTAGVVGFVWLIPWLMLYEAPEKVARLTPGELAHIRSDLEAGATGEEGKLSWFSILGYREAWSFIIGKFLTDPVWWFFLIWLPDFFKKTRGLDIKSSWVHLVSIYVIVTVLSITGGWFVGYLTRAGWTANRARKTGMFVFASAVVPIVIVTKVGDLATVVLIGIAGAAHQAWSANLFTTVSDMFPKRAVASIVGIGGMAGSVGGIVFPILTGELLDGFQAKGDITAGYTILFGFCGFAYLLAFGLGHLLAPKFRPVRMREVG